LETTGGTGGRIAAGTGGSGTRSSSGTIGRIAAGTGGSGTTSSSGTIGRIAAGTGGSETFLKLLPTAFAYESFFFVVVLFVFSEIFFIYNII
jgi:hypothetical protein